MISSHLRLALTGQLPHQTPTQSSSKGPVQTTVTSSTEKSPQKKKSRFELPRLASFNSVRFRNTINPAPVRTHTATSPEKSLEKGQESSKRGSLRLPSLPSFKSLTHKRRAPILASTTGIVELQKPARPSILPPSTFVPPEPASTLLPPQSPTFLPSQSPPTFLLPESPTFFPPRSPIPPIPPAPRPAFRSLYRGPSAPKLDIAPPSGPENSYHFSTIPQTIISSEEWVESDSHPEPVPTPRPSRSAQINLMAYLNEGGTWANIPRTESVLELNMLCDARKGSPNSHVEFDHDQTGAVSDAAIQANVPGVTGTATGQGAHHCPEEGGEEIEVRITIPSDHALRPLVEFRNLRVLRLTGMFKSYQRTIWQAVWLNPQLVTLELEMAVGLEIKEPVPRGWKPIRDGWVMNAGSFGAPVY
ncbi:hypothetical protein ACN38_g3460 [Penicillium nordicum]|uniref:Uncharacterized protein n=1 Tax=Penicillium nordicum TaxID=229535 RepID=A0A0M9WI05_9EURO|nr:hypothetical protein ACN38_g3460 [Penicillium nordicum]